MTMFCMGVSELTTVEILKEMAFTATETQRRALEDAISALSENKGEWVFDETLDKHYYCSECKSMGVDYWDYCPYCGARMKGGE